MSKRENRKAYHKAREKEYYALNKKRHKKWRESITYDYEELDKPIHVGYVKFFDIDPYLVGTKQEPIIREVLDNLQVKVFSKRKDFKYKTYKGKINILEPHFRYNDRFEDMSNEAKRLVYYSYEKEYGWRHWRDYHITYLQPSNLVVRIKKDYVYYRRILNTEAISEYQLLRNKIYHDFINLDYRCYGGRETWYHRYVNKVKRHKVNQLLRKVKTTTDLDFLDFNYDKSPEDYYW